MGVSGHSHALAALCSGKTPGTHFTGGWVGPRASLDGCGKSRSPLAFSPWTIRPVASPYTDYTILVHYQSFLHVENYRQSYVNLF